MSLTCVFLCEASPVIGAGHLARCYALKEEMEDRKWKVYFACNETTRDFYPVLKNCNVLDIDDYIKNPIISDFILLDRYDYNLSRVDLSSLKSKFLIIMSDQPVKKVDCDVLLDHVFWHRKEIYKNFIENDDCILLVGHEYSILNKSIREKQKLILNKIDNKNNISRVLVSFGGSNQSLNILKAINSLSRTGFSGEVSVVFGYAGVDEVAADKLKKIDCFKNIFIHGAICMSTEIMKADISIGSPAGSFFERCALGVPSILYPIVPHQKDISVKLKDNNVSGVLVVDDLDSSLEKAFLEFYKKDYRELSDSVKELVNINGVELIVDKIKDLFHEKCI